MKNKQAEREAFFDFYKQNKEPEQDKAEVKQNEMVALVNFRTAGYIRSNGLDLFFPM